MITVKETIGTKVKKGNVFFLQAMNACRGIRGTAPLILNLGVGGK
jgi:hypothetical protein